jgi:hypothetical protein
METNLNNLTEFDYNQVLFYSKNILNKNRILGNIIEPEELVSEAYISFHQGKKNVKQIILNIVMEEVRVVKAKSQSRLTKDTIDEKLCKKCNESKLHNEFYERIDEKSGLKYYSSECKSCQIKRQTTEEHKARRRELYKNNEKAKRNAHLRYLRYKNKQKKNLENKK